MDAHRRALRLLLLGAFAVRVWTVGYGLPFSIDEQEGHNVRLALRMGAARDLDPGLQGLYGKGFIYYPLLSLYAGLYGALRLAGEVSSPADFALYYLRSETPFLVLGRLLHVVVSTAGVAAFFAWGRAVGGPAVGLAAAALLATNPMHWMNSHFPTVETWALLFTSAGLALHARGGRAEALGLASIGLGGGTKFLDAVCAWHPWALALRRPRRLALLVGAFALGFLLANPFLLLRADRHLPRLVGIFGGEYGGGAAPAPAEYVGRLAGLATVEAAAAVGATGLLLYIAGLALGGLPRTFWAVPLAFVAFLSLFGQIGREYLMAVFPFVLVGAAAGLEALRRRLPRVAGALLAAAALLEPACRALPREARYVAPPHETAVVEWIERNVPRGATVAVLHTGLAYKLRDTAEAAARKAARERARGGKRAEYFEAVVRLHARYPGLPAYDLRWIAQPYWRPGQYNKEILDFVEGMGGWTLEEVDVPRMRAEGVEYVVLQDLGPAETRHAGLVRAFRAAVAAEGVRLARIPAAENVPVEVWRLRPAGDGDEREAERDR